MHLKKIIIVSAAALMLASVGAGVSNATSNQVHASRISTLRNRMNNDYKKSSYYGRQAKMLKREIARLSHNHKARKARRHVAKRAHKGHKTSKAYHQGYLDGYCDTGKGTNYFTNRYRHNKQYKEGFINGQVANGKKFHMPFTRKSANHYFHLYGSYGKYAVPATKKDFMERGI